MFAPRRKNETLVHSILPWAMSVLWLTAAVPALADGGAECTKDVAETTARRIQSRYDGIRDLQGRFSQTNESATFGGEPLMNTDRKTGKVVFAKPGKMRWVYEAPEPSVVVSDGQTLWIHDVEAKSATRLSVTAGFLSGAALQFLLGDGRILDTFVVEAVDCQPNRVTLDLFPKADSSYERLGLVANADSGDILATTVVDLFGNLTRIEFSDVEVNQGPKPKVFEFEAPPGVEVIEYEGAPAS